MKCPPTRARALKLARSLQSLIATECGQDVKLSLCREAITAGFGRRTWHDFEKQLKPNGSVSDWNMERAALRLGGGAPLFRSALAGLARVADPDESGTGRGLTREHGDDWQSLRDDDLAMYSRRDPEDLPELVFVRSVLDRSDADLAAFIGDLRKSPGDEPAAEARAILERFTGHAGPRRMREILLIAATEEPGNPERGPVAGFALVNRTLSDEGRGEEKTGRRSLYHLELEHVLVAPRFRGEGLSLGLVSAVGRQVIQDLDSIFAGEAGGRIRIGVSCSKDQFGVGGLLRHMIGELSVSVEEWEETNDGLAEVLVGYGDPSSPVLQLRPLLVTPEFDRLKASALDLTLAEEHPGPVVLRMITDSTGRRLARVSLGWPDDEISRFSGLSRTIMQTLMAPECLDFLQALPGIGGPGAYVLAFCAGATVLMDETSWLDEEAFRSAFPDRVFTLVDSEKDVLRTSLRFWALAPDLRALVEGVVKPRPASRPRSEPGPVLFRLRSLDRPQKIVGELCAHMGAPVEEARAAVAALYGHESWAELAEATARVVVPDAPDEQSDAATVEQRRHWHAHVLMMAQALPEHIAEAIVARLAPTAQKPVPGLAGLREELSGRLVPVGTSELDAGLKAFMEEALGTEIEGSAIELMDELRLRGAISPGIWLDVLTGPYGWTLEDLDESPSHGCEQIAVAVAKDGRRFPLFLASPAYRPGDLSDKQVDRLRRRIQKDHTAAVLLFNKPTVFMAPDARSGKVVVYGGIFLEEGRWHDFALKRGLGFDGVLRQKGRFQPIPDAAFRAEYEDGIDLAADLSHILAGHTSRAYRIGMLRTSSGWSHILTECASPDASPGRRKRAPVH